MTRSIASLPLRHQDSAASLRSASTTMDAPSPAPERGLSWEAQCFILAEMDRAPKSENKVCRGCMLGLTPPQQANAVRAESSQDYRLLDRPSCNICHLRSLKPEAFTKPFTQFLTENPTIFHAVDYFKQKLAAVGFTEVGRAPLSDASSKLRKLTCSSPAARSGRLVRSNQAWRQVLCHAQRQHHRSVRSWRGLQAWEWCGHHRRPHRRLDRETQAR